MTSTSTETPTYLEALEHHREYHAVTDRTSGTSCSLCTGERQLPIGTHGWQSFGACSFEREVWGPNDGCREFMSSPETISCRELPTHVISWRALCGNETHVVCTEHADEIIAELHDDGVEPHVSVIASAIAAAPPQHRLADRTPVVLGMRVVDYDRETGELLDDERNRATLSTHAACLTDNNVHTTCDAWWEVRKDSGRVTAFDCSRLIAEKGPLDRSSERGNVALSVLMLGVIAFVLVSVLPALFVVARTLSSTS